MTDWRKKEPWAQGIRRAVGVLLTAAAALYLMVYFFPPGIYTDAQTDAAMLEETTGSSLPSPAVLFPLTPGVRRTYQETPAPNDGDSFAPRWLETRVSGDVRMVGMEQGMAVESRLDGAPFQTEVYRVDERGIYGLATGPRAEVVLSPPLPILPADARPGTVREWRGFLTGAGRGADPIPARALCRLDGPETVTTPAGKFSGVYRVDLHVRVGDAPSAGVPPPTAVSTLWLAPGVGVVRQEIPLETGRVTLEYLGDPAAEKQAAEP